MKRLIKVYGRQPPGRIMEAHRKSLRPSGRCVHYNAWGRNQTNRLFSSSALQSKTLPHRHTHTHTVKIKSRSEPLYMKFLLKRSVKSSVHPLLHSFFISIYPHLHLGREFSPCAERKNFFSHRLDIIDQKRKNSEHGRVWENLWFICFFF